MKNLILGTVVTVVGILGIAELRSPSPLFIWNKTESVEKGLYLRGSGHFQRGDIAAVMPPDHVRSLLTKREYLPENVPLLKRIAAMENDRICRIQQDIFINETAVAFALQEDSEGRKMPVWEGCFTLSADEFFLLNSHPKSLDGRYFGISDEAQIIGKYRLIWGVKTGAEPLKSGPAAGENEAPRRAR